MSVSGNGRCTGVLIDDTAVLTAAHCCQFSGKKVSGGSNRISTHPVSAKAKRVYQHPHYDSETFANDVCIIILESPLVGDFLRPIEISSREAEVETRCKVAGYGRTSNVRYSLDTSAKHPKNLTSSR